MPAKSTTPIERPPIVVVLGHVDHGKSTLLDYIRKTNTVEKEMGGITQHVAAYEVEHRIAGNSKKITFIDTPGHAAFEAIRRRGASVADIAILVVAADDGVKAQTLEALNSIKDADIPYIVAINKIDKSEASLERAQASLMENHVYLEKLGGDVPWVPTSAKTGEGVPELLNLVLVVAELHAYTGDPSLPAEGYVIEAHRDVKRGIAATLIIVNGTLESGMAVLAGSAIAPVRIMEDHTGRRLTLASFSTPVTLVGFDELPEAGASFRSFENKKGAEAARENKKSDLPHEIPRAVLSEEKYFIPLIVRADTTGSLDAIKHETQKIENERAGINIIQSGIGAISEGDIKAAAANSADSALVIGFNVSPDPLALERARQTNVQIQTFDIIYKLTEALERLVSERTPKREVEELLGRARIIKTFSNQKDIRVVGGAVLEGRLQRGASVRVLRRKVEVGTGKIKNVQSHKQNVERVEAPSEFGLEIKSGFEIAPGDVLECFTTTIK